MERRDLQITEPKPTGFQNALDYRFIFGLLAACCLILPYFGRSFSLFGLHLRIVTAGLMLLLFCGSAAAFRFKNARFDIGIPVALLLALILLHSSSVQFQNLLVPQIDRPYIEGKTASILQLTLPYMVLGLAMSPLRENETFYKGFWWACIAGGILGMTKTYPLGWYLFQWFGDHEFRTITESGFSYAGMSLILSFFILSLVEGEHSKPIQYLPNIILGLLAVYLVLILRQRAHMISLALILAVRLLKADRRRATAIGVIVLIMVGAAVGLWAEHIWTQRVSLYWKAAVSGKMFAERLSLFIPAISGGFENLLGHGVGEYAVNHEYAYPHNLLLEAWYELGLPGLVVMGWIYVLALAQLVFLFFGRSGELSRTAWLVLAIECVLFLHFQKSGDFRAMGPLFLVMWIAPGPGLRETFNTLFRKGDPA